MKRKIVGLVLMGLFIQGPAFAANDQWEYALTPYLWFAGIKGEVSTLPGAPVVPIEVSPSDALSDTQASFMLLFEAKKQRHGMLFDILYTDTESDIAQLPNLGVTLKSISRNKMFSAAYQYELYDEQQAVVDIFGGLRYWKVDTQLEFAGSPPLGGRNLRNDDTWVDPLIGIKSRVPFGSSKFYAAGWLAAGGFGVGSDSFYDVSLNFGYQWNKPIGTTVGYRYVDVDYEDGSFVYDVYQDGWGIALTWSF